MRYQLKIFTLFFNKIYLFSSFLQFIWKNVQDLKSYNPFIYKGFLEGLNKSVSTIEFDYYSFSSLLSISIWRLISSSVGNLSNISLGIYSFSL